jgi:hypothetical protein
VEPPLHDFRQRTLDFYGPWTIPGRDELGPTLFYGREVLNPAHAAAAQSEGRGAPRGKIHKPFGRLGHISDRLHLLTADLGASQRLPTLGAGVSALEAELKRLENSFDAADGPAVTAPPHKSQRAPNGKHKRDACTRTVSPRRVRAVRPVASRLAAPSCSRSAATPTAENAEPAYTSLPALISAEHEVAMARRGSQPEFARRGAIKAEPAHAPGTLRARPSQGNVLPRVRRPSDFTADEERARSSTHTLLKGLRTVYLTH